VAVAPRIQRCFLQSIATRFLRKLLSRARGVGRSSAKRMYVRTFMLRNTYTYVHFRCTYCGCIYTPVFSGYQHHPLKIPAGYYPGHTHTHTHIYIYIRLPAGQGGEKKIKEPGFWHRGYSVLKARATSF